jgi:hypothetical protein
MTEEIRVIGVGMNDDETGGYVHLGDGQLLGSFPFHVDGRDSPYPDPTWTWENPDDESDEITLSPSIRFELDDEYHLRVQNGSIKML